FGVAQRRGPLGGDGQAVAPRVLEQGGRQVHRPQRRVALVDLQLPVQLGLRRVADVGNDPVHLPGRRPARPTAAQLETAVGAAALDRLDRTLRVKLHVGVAAGGERVGADGELVALAERVVDVALDGLRARAAGQPDDPGAGVRLAQAGEAAD